MTSIQEKFEQVEQSGEPGWLGIGGDLTVDLRVGVDAGMRAIVLRSPVNPPNPPDLAALHIERRQVAPTSWLLVIRLERRELAALFTVLAEDLAVHTADAKPEVAAELAVRRLLAWQRLLARAPSGVLPDTTLRGMLAELVLLREAIGVLGVEDAVLGWHGPAKAPQDFGFGFLRIEVKAIHAGQSHVRISSPEQLSSDDCPMLLHAQVIELVGEKDALAVQVADFVDELAGLIGVTATALERFERGLFEYGFVRLPAYAALWFRAGSVLDWEVSAHFPRVVRADLPAAVDELEYTLDLNALPPPEATSWQTRVPK